MQKKLLSKLPKTYKNIQSIFSKKLSKSTENNKNVEKVFEWDAPLRNYKFLKRVL